MVLSLKLNQSLFFIFLFVIVSSFLAYKIIVKAYSGVYDFENSATLY